MVGSEYDMETASLQPKASSTSVHPKEAVVVVVTATVVGIAHTLSLLMREGRM